MNATNEDANVIPRSPLESSATRAALIFGLLGGGVAWTAHLLLAYAIAEFGCVSRFRDASLLGISGVAWLVLTASVFSLALAVAAVVVAARSRRRLQEEGRMEGRDAESFLAHAGLITSGLFVFIILVQTVPIFYYLRDC